MAVIAQHISGESPVGEYRPEITRDDHGRHGVQHWWVNTADELRAHTATNLPRYGEAWKPGENLFRCYSITCKYFAGTNVAGTDEGGLTKATLLYREPGDGSPLPYPGSVITWFETRISSVRQVQDVRLTDGGSGGDISLPIENGRGVSREVAFTVLRTRIYPTDQSPQSIIARSSAAIDFSTRQVVNSNQLVFRNYLGTGLTYTVSPNTARFHEVSPGREAGFNYFDFSFLLGPSPAFWFWWTVDAAGLAVRRVQSQVYDIANLGNVIEP